MCEVEVAVMRVTLVMVCDLFCIQVEHQKLELAIEEKTQV